MPIFYGPSTYFSDRTPENLALLALDTANPKELVATAAEARDLFKVKLESFVIEDPDNPPNLLAEAGVSLNFPNIREGNEGIIEIKNNPGETRLTLDSFLSSNAVTGDPQVKQSGTTVFKFVYLGGVYHFLTVGDAPKSSTENREITLNVRHTGSDDLGGTNSDFKTLTGALRWTIKNARFAADSLAFSTDNPKNSVTINVYNNEENTPFPETIHLPDMPDIGIHILGVSNSAGIQPIVDASDQSSQFERGLFSRNSRYITIENIHLKNDKGICTVTRNSELNLIDCTLECVDAVEKRHCVLVSSFSRLRIAGKLKIVFASAGSIFFRANKYSTLTLSNVVGTHEGNRNAGLSIVTNSPVEFDQILESNNFSGLTIDDYLDGSDDGVERYIAGDIYSQNPTKKIGFNSRIENNSIKFP